MFIVTKEVMKDIVKYGIEWQKYIENEDSISALVSFVLAPGFIFFLIISFIGDIVFLPLETIIYLAIRKARNERNK